MWNCPKCAESLDDNFAICWQCGTDREGQIDAGFHREPDQRIAVMEQESPRPRRWQFSLTSLFLIVSCWALVFGLSWGLPEIFVVALVGIIIANLFGLIVGLFVTFVLGFPTDGSLRQRGDVVATEVGGGRKADVEVPLCLNCLRPVSRLDHYCPHCGQSVGQWTPYLPYEGIWFNAGMWGKLWDRLWYKKVDSVARKWFFVFLILMGAPILLLALPTVWWWKSKKRRQA